MRLCSRMADSCLAFLYYCNYIGYLCHWTKIHSVGNRTTEEFIAEARQVHGDRYDYSRVNYVNAHSKVEILCPRHGSFWQEAKSHLIGKGCPKCAGNSKHTQEEFINLVRSVHGNKYSLEKAHYKGYHTKVTLTCPIHGDFDCSPSNLIHRRGGCPKCGHARTIRSLRLFELEFVDRAHQVHGDKYDYSKTEYRGWARKVIITCPFHGDFEQRAGNHLNGRGCPKCGKEISAYKHRK